MTVNNSITQLTDDDAFCAGADLWVVQSNQNKWWQQIDFKSGFLLSSSLLFQKNNDSSKVHGIVQKTETVPFDFTTPTKHLLLGTTNHFFNKWVLVLDSDIDSALPEIEKISQQLKANGIRFFNISRNDVIETTTRLTASLPEISFVE
ncbi:MAG: hypothetical protein H7256_08990 [Bdellovibrio sp.]|nr:hypothetical protein [Bdellovibrio sp.]